MTMLGKSRAQIRDVTSPGSHVSTLTTERMLGSPALRSRLVRYASSMFSTDDVFSHESDEKGKFRSIGRMLLIVLLPTVALLGALAAGLNDSFTMVTEATTASKSMSHSSVIVRMVAALQVERGLTSAYVTSAEDDRALYQKVMNAQFDLDAVVGALDKWVQFSINENVTFESAMHFSRHLTEHRTRLLVERSRIRFNDNIRFYTDYTHALLGAIEDGVTLPPVQSVWSRFVGYMAILHRSDTLGILRALGSVYLTQCHLDTDDRFWFVQVQAEGDEYRHVMTSYYPDLGKQLTLAEKSSHSGIIAAIDSLTSEVIDDVRSHACANQTEADTSARRSQWFSNMTSFIQFHNQMALTAADVIKEHLDVIVTSAQRKVMMYSVFITVLTLICAASGVWYGARIHRMATNIQKFARYITTKVQALNVERKRTERLLYQMLPRSVAEQLKHGLAVTPKHYSMATIFFSDIYGFSDVTSSLTPHQVVDILNALYRLFDDTLEKYDVYKMETVGDCYMLVSGLPVPNGDVHVREVALLSLELLAKVTTFIPPHDVTRRLELRVGIHSGPVVAGVVGTKMPRFCLFGDSVNVASRMETNGRRGFRDYKYVICNSAKYI